MNEIEKLEKRVDKIEDKVNSILQEIAGFKPILETMNDNIKRISDNSIARDRVEKLENKVEKLEEELDNRTVEQQAETFTKIKWIIISCIVTAFVTSIIASFIK